MEKSIPKDDNRKRGDPIIASKSVGSFVKIDSISIDLDDANDDSSHAVKCEHFSIRGYVSEIRKKNWKICWPFALDGDLNKLDQEKKSMLPPMDVPKYRSWCCQNCLREVGSRNVTKVHGTDSNRHVGSNTNSTGAQMTATTNNSLLQSNCKQGPKSKILEGKQFDPYTSTIVDGNEIHPSSRIDKKKRNGEVSLTTIIANENGLNDGSHKMHRVISVETEVNNTNRTEDSHSEPIRLECNGSVNLRKQGFESHVDNRLDFEITKNKFWNKNSTQISESEYQAFAGNKQGSICSSGLLQAKMTGEADNAVKVQTNVYRPSILDEYDDLSSDNHDRSSGFQRKKSRKVRLLTELLCNNGDSKNDCTRREDSSSNTVNNTSEVGSVPKGQVSLPENAGARSGENKKRKFSEEEEKRGHEMSHPKTVTKNIKTLKQDGEATNAFAGTGLDEEAFARISLRGDMKSNWSRYENERMETVGKKRAKKSHDFNAYSTLVHSKENVLIEGRDKFGDLSTSNATNGASFRLVFDASTLTDQFPFPSLRKEKKSVASKRKGKMPQSDTRQASLFPSPGMLRKDSNTREDAEINQPGKGTVPFHQTEAATTEKGLDLSLNSYLAAHRYDSTTISQHEDGFPSLSTWKDSTCKLDEFMRKNVEVNYLATLNKPSTSMSNPFSEEGVCSEPNKNIYTYSMPMLNGKHNYSSQVEQGSSLIKQMDISRASKNQKIVEVEKNSGVPVIRKHSNHRADKMSEKGNLDDIPMEIVELMAKNQYERCRHETENVKKVSEHPNKARNAQVAKHSPVNDIGDLRLLDATSQKWKPQARNAKNGTTAKTVGTAQQKSVDYISYINGNQFGTSRLDQMHCSTGFGPFNQSQKKPSSRVQFPAASYSTCSCAQNCKWNGDMVGHGFSHSKCQSALQSKEETARVWSSAMPVQSPFMYKNPQKGAAQLSNVEMLSGSPGLLNKGNASGDCDLSLNLNAPNFEKRNEAVGFGPFSRTNSEISFTCKRNGTEPHPNSTGPLDLYSNETIPAMHLLSLMDAGRPSAPLNMSGNPKSIKRPFPNDLYSKPYPGLDIGIYKASDNVNHPSINGYANNHLSDKSLDLFPTNPTFGASTSSYENSRGSGKAADFMGQVSSSRKKEKIQRSHPPAPDIGPRSQKSLRTDGFGDNVPVHSIQKGLLPVSGPTMFPMQQYQTFANSLQHNMGSHNTNGTMQPPKRTFEPAFCCVNRNPAEIRLPDVRNEYMIRGEDLKFAKQRRGSSKVDQQKRQRNTKGTTEKDRA